MFIFIVSFFRNQGHIGKVVYETVTFFFPISCCDVFGLLYISCQSFFPFSCRRFLHFVVLSVSLSHVYLFTCLPVYLFFCYIVLFMLLQSAIVCSVVFLLAQQDCQDGWCILPVVSASGFYVTICDHHLLTSLLLIERLFTPCLLAMWW